MPASYADLEDESERSEPLTSLPFPHFHKSHILHCSYHYWHPKYRALTPKARLIPLSPAFVAYLRADGIILPDDDSVQPLFDEDSADGTSADEDESESEIDPSTEWRDIHSMIKSTIVELGGKVVPKLNWSSPKDATWINANSMDCRTPNDVYLLLKSSDFVTHDLEHAFDGCVDEENIEAVHEGTDATSATETTKSPTTEIPFHLVLRKHVMFNPAVEFRCFVRRRRLLGMCQRDLNHFDFLFTMQDDLSNTIQAFFDDKLKDTFPDENFAFDVYIPAPHNRVWLVDINPWAPRTDPLLFSWLELLTMPEPPPAPSQALREDFVRLSLTGEHDRDRSPISSAFDIKDNEDDVEAEVFQPELRLIKKDDPEAYTFNTPQYSAHKLPRDVVEASQSGPGPMREFAEQWRDVLERRRREDEESDTD